ncbi:MAG: NTPase [Deltaproteobacteria bacterium]|nr:MAG: NTPase [Deltaproteobacteria bacterium]
MRRPVHLLVTGRPGSGKTTVVERVVASLPKGAASGFFTREVRERGVRRGFTIQTLDGRTAVLADVRAGAPRVGRYRVRLDGLEAVGVPALARRPGVRLIVVDEIGKMECLSRPFCDAVREALGSRMPVLGTIACQGGGFVAEVRRRADVRMVEVTPRNRDDLPRTIVATLGLEAAPPDDESDHR